MKLLLDENLSPRLIELLADVYREVVHVDGLGLGSHVDGSVWSHARTHGFTIVSKDSDFANYSALRGAPPKVIWIRLDNCSTAALEMLLRNSVQTISRFIEGEESCLILGRKTS